MFCCPEPSKITDTIAKYILIRECNHNRFTSNLRLQKLMYFCYVQCLIELNIKCFDDKIMAWGFGPIIPTIYYKFCRYGSMPIIYRSSDITNHENIFLIPPKVRKSIDSMCDACAKYSDIELTEKTYNSIFYKTKSSYSNQYNDEDIKKYYFND